jgi:hypothetical protein
MTNRVLGVVSSDPLTNLPIGSSIKFKIINFGSSNATQNPGAVNNWEYFRGALMALVLKFETGTQMIGTAFMVAPGLAITATHNIFEHINDMSRGEIIPYCMGIRDATVNLWRVLNITYSPDDDITLFSIGTVSEISTDKTYYQFGITTRAPKNGEKIHIVGFRGKAIVNKSNEIDYFSNIYTSVGTVTAVYPSGRDKLLMPYPVIEINCGSIGGMSGGVAIDKNGLVVGIISRALDTEDQCGPTYVSWIIKSLTKNIQLSWPSGFYTTPTSLLSMDSRLVFIDKREALAGSTENELKYRVWFE